MKNKIILPIMIFVLFAVMLAIGCGGESAAPSSGRGVPDRYTVTGEGSDFFIAERDAFAQAVLQAVKNFVGNSTYNSNRTSIENTFAGNRLDTENYYSPRYVDRDATQTGNWVETAGQYSVTVIVDLDAIEDKLDNMGLLAAQPTTTTRPTQQTSQPIIAQEPTVEEPPPAQTSTERPDWIENKPSASGTYYFVGMGSGDEQAGARDVAVNDAMNQVVLAINATITSNTSFSSIVRESDTSAQQASTTSSRIRMRGAASISQFDIESQYFASTSNGYQCFVLVTVPESIVQEAIAEIERMRQELANSPTIVVAYSVDVSGNVVAQDTLKTRIEEFYQLQGYNIRQIFFNTGTLRGRDINAHIQSIFDANLNARRVIVAAIRASEVTQISGTSFISILGTLSLREIKLDTQEIVDSQTFDGKGISSRTETDAYEELVVDIIDSIFESEGMSDEPAYNQDSWF